MIDPRSKQLVFNASNESFTEDKKMVYLCIKDKQGKYYDYNMLMYVALHELAHAFSESVDMEHKGDEFKNNFKQLLDKAERMGYFDSTKPLDYNYCPKI
jgi:predicted SprT family Zn-dependent metalloprotease